jgi:ribosomal protein S18 acetylase RimI-like enzyme
LSSATLAEGVVVPAAEITFALLDGRQAKEHEAELQALRDEACAGLNGTGEDDTARISGSFQVRRRQPGFVLAEARSGGYLIGYAAGMPLRPSTSWWRELTAALPEHVTAEQPGRTFALTDLAVRPSWRRQRIGADLHDLILSGRAEERATVMVPQAAVAALAAFQSWGWRRIARTRGGEPGSPGSDVLVSELPAAGR